MASGDLEATLKAAQAELQTSEASLSAVRAEDAKLNAEIKKLQSERSQLSAEEDKLKAELAALAREKAALVKESLVGDESEESLKKQIQEKEREVKGFVKRLEEMKASNTASQEDCERMHRLVASVEGELSKLREKASVCQLTLQHVKEKIEKLRRKLETKDIEKAQVLYNIKTREGGLTEEIRRTNEEFQRMQDEVKSRVEEAKQREKELVAELEKLRKSSRRKEPAKSVSSVHVSEPSVEQLKDLNRQLDAKVEELTSLQSVSDKQFSTTTMAFLLLFVGFGIGLVSYPFFSGFMHKE